MLGITAPGTESLSHTSTDKLSSGVLALWEPTSKWNACFSLFWAHFLCFSAFQQKWKEMENLGNLTIRSTGAHGIVGFAATIETSILYVWVLLHFPSLIVFLRKQQKMAQNVNWECLEKVLDTRLQVIAATWGVNWLRENCFPSLSLSFSYCVFSITLLFN